MASKIELQAVSAAVIDRWGVPDRRGKTKKWWSDLYFETEWNRVQNELTMVEYEEFLRLCAVCGVPSSKELPIFRSVICSIAKYGDTGFGEKPEDMTRIVYWFQHVPEAVSGIQAGTTQDQHRSDSGAQVQSPRQPQ